MKRKYCFPPLFLRMDHSCNCSFGDSEKGQLNLISFSSCRDFKLLRFLMGGCILMVLHSAPRISRQAWEMKWDRIMKGHLLVSFICWNGNVPPRWNMSYSHWNGLCCKDIWFKLTRVLNWIKLFLIPFMVLFLRI